MTINTACGFLHLNRANTWPEFELHDLAVSEEGALYLADVSVQRGRFCAGPIEVSEWPTRWQRLRVDAEPLPLGSHVQLFTLTAHAHEPPSFDLTADEPFLLQDGWHRFPRDLLDGLILNNPAPCLWIGGVLRRGEGGTPQLRQMRVDYGRDGYLKHLPALFARDPEDADLLDRLLALDESLLEGLGDRITDLPRLFDTLAAPAGAFPSWLSWLAGWQAFELSELWQEAETRRYLGEAFDLHGKRGTVEGLRRYLKRYAGVEAHIVEPARQTHLWSLGEISTLGFTTMLAPAHPQGAVVGTTAILDQSHLTTDEAFGEALFSDLAHHFCVSVYCAELTRPGALDDVRTVLAREKPAHSTYELCVIEPRMQVGSQAYVGIDAIVAEGPPAARIGVSLGSGTLAAQAETCLAPPLLSVNEEET
jgi:phage tail-like protein